MKKVLKKWAVGAVALTLASYALAQDVVVSDAWARLLPKEKKAVAYLTVENNGKSPVTIKGFESPVFSKAELQMEEISDQGVQELKTKESYTILPGRKLIMTFATGTHVMLSDQKKELGQKEKIPIIVHFDGQGDINVEAENKWTETVEGGLWQK